MLLEAECTTPVTTFGTSSVVLSIFYKRMIRKGGTDGRGTVGRNGESEVETRRGDNGRHRR